MDEAVALITAGNQIAQDPDSVGAAMRTIALRLTGTKVAIQELQDKHNSPDYMVTYKRKLA